ncbi:NACHT, LRR and PYD domains-containing protein 12-like [Silurus asotus]|uniref:NACHT, LRR and PYD domains-containing protein 12-like n=1 Tax=Silurus asotus TaxID=30991 RepID=A0AAD5FEG1_SILAS|nr:NACHT, LRR and PYD domains-containing protein 12-like [Silurus asotus]
MKSDWSIDLPLEFSTGISSPGHRHDPESPAADEFQKKFKFNLMKKFQRLNGFMPKQENLTLLNEIYTELYITEGDSGDVNKEHEVKQIEAASRRNPTEDTPIKCSDIFKPLLEQDKAIRNVLTKPLSEQDEEPIRSILTKGVAGIGKTVSVQKFVLDWAEGKTNQDVHLIFPLPFRELNLMKEQKLSLVELLHVFFKEMKEMDISRLEKVLFIFDGLDECRFPLDFQKTEMKEMDISRLEKVLFIFDGLDECRFPLDFQKTVRVCDVTESAPVHVLLINLIKGNLLPSALIWITSRPAAADQIPSECVHRVTEVRGFNDPQKEEYFRKRISDENLANKIITHLKSLRSLYIMCHIPVFCWISAAVLERMLGEAESGEIPKTLTQMYTHFLIIQTNIIREKYPQEQESDEEMLPKLGKLAFQQLEKQNLIFYEEDLRECDIDATEAAVYSGVCTQIFREEFGLYQIKVFCFIHLSIQEHLAALYVHLSFIKEQKNILKWNQVCETLSDVHRSAVNQAVYSQTGHFDLFLRFLLGLSLESNQKLLHSLVTQTGSSSQNKEETIQYIKEMISEDLPSEKSINLFHCLNELGDDSLVEEIQQYLKSGAQGELSPSQWSALVFVLLTSAQDLEEFDLNKYFTPDKIRDEILVRVMPVIAASRKAMIRCSEITERSGKALTSVLNSETSSLRELHLTVNTLNLSRNKLEDSGVKRLSALLENPECKVKDLRLCDCGISDEGYAALASALRSNPSHLRELNLSRNKVGDSGVKCLSAVLENPHCKLEILWLEILFSLVLLNVIRLEILFSLVLLNVIRLEILFSLVLLNGIRLEILFSLVLLNVIRLEILFSLVLLNVIRLEILFSLGLLNGIRLEILFSLVLLNGIMLEILFLLVLLNVIRLEILFSLVLLNGIRLEILFSLVLLNGIRLEILFSLVLLNVIRLEILFSLVLLNVIRLEILFSLLLLNMIRLEILFSPVLLNGIRLEILFSLVLLNGIRLEILFSLVLLDVIRLEILFPLVWLNVIRLKILFSLVLLDVIRLKVRLL